MSLLLLFRRAQDLLGLGRLNAPAARLITPVRRVRDLTALSATDATPVRRAILLET